MNITIITSMTIIDELIVLMKGPDRGKKYLEPDYYSILREIDSHFGHFTEVS